MTHPPVLRLGPAVALGALGGWLTRLAFPAPGWWPFALLGVALWVLASAGRTWRSGTLIGLGYGLAFFLPLLHWSGIYVGPMPWIALSVLQAGYLALLGASLPRALRTHHALAAPTVAGLWVAQEALRDRTPYGGFPWGRLAFSQADGPIGALAAWGGAPLVTFAVALGGALIGLAALHLRWRSIRAGVLAGAAAGAVIAAGLLVPLPTSGRLLQVAAIQGNVPKAGLDFNAHRRAVLDNHARVTRQLAGEVAAGRATQPQIVLWPENSSDLDPFQQPDARAVIDGAVDAIGAPTLVGTVLNRPDGRLTNASIAWAPHRGPGQVYAKRHPVPFAEYIPDRAFFRKLSTEVDLLRRDFVGGTRVGRIDLGPARLGVAICFEVAYDDLVRDTVRAGADLLVVQTNNATFGRTDEAAQQLAMSRLRAVEHGRALVHVSTVGISALIAPDGRLLTSTKLFTPAILQAALPLRTQLTVADRVGAWPEAGLSAVALLVLLLVGARERLRRSPDRLAAPVSAAGALALTEAR